MIKRLLSHTPFEALLNAAVDGIIVIDDGGQISIINHAAEALFGYVQGELIGVNVKHLMPPPDRDQHDSYLQKYLATGERKMIGIGRKTIGKKKDNSEFPMYLSVGHIAELDKTSFVGIIRDLTDQENNEQAILQSEKEIRQLRERLTHVARISTMGEMATGIAHEINQPLTAIATYAQASRRMIQGDDGTEPGQLNQDLLDVLEKIDQQAQRASSVISGIRQLSRRHSFECKNVSCHDVIYDVVSLAQSYAHEKALDIKVELSEAVAQQQISVDLIQTQQVLLNLINNAIESMYQYIDENSIAEINDISNIIISARKLDDTLLEIAVVDHGVGIDVAHQHQVFDAFFSTKPAGLGMGLSICQSIIGNQGGSIAFKPNADHGCTFTITLPLAIV